jgi:cell filamentation protein
LELFDQENRFTADDICTIHKLWLASIYDWAGSYRQVNISKGGFPFDMARQVPALMLEFERNQLHQYTPCLFTDQEEIIHAIAEVHTELVLIHPFREGNGRLARMVAVLMSLQAGLPPLDFSSITGSFKQQYFNAVQAGMDLNYKHMEEIFRVVLEETIKQK